MKIGDLAGLSEPLKKLLSVVAAGIGRVTKAHYMKKDADAKAYELRTLAAAQADRIKMIGNAIQETFPEKGQIAYKDESLSIGTVEKSTPIEPAEIQLEERTESRINYQEAKRQLNIENVIATAAEELEPERKVSDTPVDDDWINRFFNIVGDVSAEEMQQLWGKILAGEIKQPKSFSLRTLEILRNLTKSEAEVFTKIANMSFTESLQGYMFKTRNYEKFLKDFGISYGEITLMKEVGIIQSVESSLTINRKTYFVAGDYILKVEPIVEEAVLQLPVEVFTQAGSQLLQLLSIMPPKEYLMTIATGSNPGYFSTQFTIIDSRVRVGEYKTKMSFKEMSELDKFYKYRLSKNLSPPI